MSESSRVLKFSAIFDFFANADERGLISRGENAVESGRIKNLKFDPDLRTLKGEVFASMKNKTYNVEVNLDSYGEIQTVSCSCPRGQYLCHHVAALCIYGHYNISKTDVECQWSIRRPKNDQPKTIEEIYQPRTHRSTNRNLSATEITQFQTKLSQFGTAVGFTWLLRDEPSPDTNVLPDIQEFLFSAEYIETPNKKISFVNKMQVTEQLKDVIVSMTIGQSSNSNWLAFKKNRLTASNFGVVCAAITRNKFPPSLYKRLAGSYNLNNVKAVQWGCLNEATAIQQFTRATGLDVRPTGLHLHECGFLGCSPDGFVGNDSIIEVKCPFKYRDKDIKMELLHDKNYIVHYDENFHCILNKKHEYYHQIQGTLAITNKVKCHLIIWTPKKMLHIEIQRDPKWEINLQKLKDFFLNRYIPYLVGECE